MIMTPLLAQQVRASSASNAIHTSPRRHSIVALILIGSALVLWFIALTNTNTEQLSDYGLLSVLSTAFYAAISLLTISFVLALRNQALPTSLLAIHVVALILIIYGTPALVYEAPRYGWTYKHIGVVSYIQQQGRVAFDADPYFNWPGFFAFNALIIDVIELGSALSYAAWAQLFFNLLYLLGLLLIFGSLTTDRRRIWLGAWFFLMTNWTGTDYFAPQSISYFMHLIILGACLKWLRAEPDILQSRLGALPLPRNLVSTIARFFQQADRDICPVSPANTGQELGIKVIAIMLFCALIISHQLTPFMTLGSIVALVVFQRVRTRSLPILAGTLLVTWILFVAYRFVEGNVLQVFGSIGNLESNITGNVFETSGWRQSAIHVALCSRGVALAIWILALLGGIRRLFHGHLDLTAAILAIVLFPMIALQSYGGEMLYRIYFFSLPFMAFLATGAFYPFSTSVQNLRVTFAILATSLSIMGGFLFAFYGHDLRSNITNDDLEAVQFIYRNAPVRSLILDANGNYPREVESYREFTHRRFLIEANFGPEVDDEFARTLERVMAREREDYPGVYLMLTQSQKRASDYFRYLPEGSLDELEQHLMRSHALKLAFSNRTAKVFVLADDLKR